MMVSRNTAYHLHSTDDIHVGQRSNKLTVIGPGHGQIEPRRHISKSVSQESLSNEEFRSGFDPKVFDFLRVPAEEYARYVTLVDAPIFQRIQPDEFTSVAWNTREKLIKTPNIVAFTRRFNTVNFWVQKVIIYTDPLKTRADVIAHFVKIAKRLFEMGNLHASKAVIVGLTSASVYRLRKTWDLLPRKEKATYEKLKEIFSEKDNHRLLRDVLQKAKLPCLPYLGMYLHDVYFVDLAHPHSGGLESHPRRNKMNNILRIIADLQRSDYSHLRSSPHLAQYFEQYQYIEELQKFLEDDNFKRSLQVEPVVIGSSAPPPPPSLSSATLATHQQDIHAVADVKNSISASVIADSMGSPELTKQGPVLTRQHAVQSSPSPSKSSALSSVAPAPGETTPNNKVLIQDANSRSRLLPASSQENRPASVNRQVSTLSGDSKPSKNHHRKTQSHGGDAQLTSFCAKLCDSSAAGRCQILQQLGSDSSDFRDCSISELSSKLDAVCPSAYHEGCRLPKLTVSFASDTNRNNVNFPEHLSTEQLSKIIPRSHQFGLGSAVLLQRFNSTEPIPGSETVRDNRRRSERGAGHRRPGSMGASRRGSSLQAPALPISSAVDTDSPDSAEFDLIASRGERERPISSTVDYECLLKQSLPTEMIVTEEMAQSIVMESAHDVSMQIEQLVFEDEVNPNTCARRQHESTCCLSRKNLPSAASVRCDSLPKVPVIVTPSTAESSRSSVVSTTRSKFRSLAKRVLFRTKRNSSVFYEQTTAYTRFNTDSQGSGSDQGENSGHDESSSCKDSRGELCAFDEDVIPDSVRCSCRHDRALSVCPIVSDNDAETSNDTLEFSPACTDSPNSDTECCGGGHSSGLCKGVAFGDRIHCSASSPPSLRRSASCSDDTVYCCNATAFDNELRVVGDKATTLPPGMSSRDGSDSNWAKKDFVRLRRELVCRSGSHLGRKPVVQARHLLDDSIIEEEPTSGEVDVSVKEEALKNFHEEANVHADDAAAARSKRSGMSAISQDCLLEKCRSNASDASSEFREHRHDTSNVTLASELKRKILTKRGSRPKLSYYERLWVELIGATLHYYKAKSLNGHDRSAFKRDVWKSVDLRRGQWMVIAVFEDDSLPLASSTSYPVSAGFISPHIGLHPQLRDNDLEFSNRGVVSRFEPYPDREVHPGVPCSPTHSPTKQQILEHEQMHRRHHDDDTPSDRYRPLRHLAVADTGSDGVWSSGFASHARSSPGSCPTSSLPSAATASVDSDQLVHYSHIRSTYHSSVASRHPPDNEPASPTSPARNAVSRRHPAVLSSTSAMPFHDRLNMPSNLNPAFHANDGSRLNAHIDAESSLPPFANSSAPTRPVRPISRVASAGPEMQSPHGRRIKDFLLFDMIKCDQYKFRAADQASTARWYEALLHILQLHQNRAVVQGDLMSFDCS